MSDEAAWSRMLKEGLRLDQDKGHMVSRYEFGQMTKKFGKAYIEYLAACWAAWDPSCGSEMDFVDRHCIPVPFFEKTVKAVASGFTTTTTVVR